MKPTLKTTKSILAKLLATENFNIEHGKYDTPAFDTQNRVLYLPTWPEMDNDLYDLFVSHEVSHALHTPNEGWHGNIGEKGAGYKSFLNVIEDARIEKLIKRKYPGLKIPMRKGYNQLIQKDFFGISDIDVNDLPFIDRINIHTKSGWIDDDILFNEEELEMLEEVRLCETFEEVVAITDKIYEYSKDKESLTDNYVDFVSSSEQQTEKSNESLDDSIESTSMKDESDSQPLDENSDEDTNKSSNKKSSSDEEENKDENDKKSPTTGGWGFNNQEPQSITDKNYRENEKNLLEEDNGKRPNEYVYIPKVKSEDFITGHKEVYNNLHNQFNQYFDEEIQKILKDEFDTFMKENVKVVNYLVKEFETKKRANLHLRAKTSKTGVVESSSIYKYKFSDNIFKRITTLPEGKNHGLVMLLDWSGSMHLSMYSTIQQTLILAMFCRKVNIEFDVFSFHDFPMGLDRLSIYSYEKYKNIDYKFKDHAVSTVNLRQLLSSEMSKREFNQIAFYIHSLGWMVRNRSLFDDWCLCGTPLDSSLLVMFDYLEKFKTNKKLDIVNLVVLSDGDSHTNKLHYNPSEFAPFDGKFESYRYTNAYMVDRLTKSQYLIEHSWFETDCILNLLRDRTQVNIVNFYVCDKRDLKYLFRTGKIESDYDEINESLKKSGSAVAKSSGWDEMYLIPRNKLELDDTDYLENLDENATKAQLRKAFSKNNNKVKGRVVLQKFIEMIS